MASDELLSTKKNIDEISKKALEVAIEIMDGHDDEELQLTIAFVLNKYVDALLWCSGSVDFQVGGQARTGWNKFVVPLIKCATKCPKCDSADVDTDAVEGGRCVSECGDCAHEEHLTGD